MSATKTSNTSTPEFSSDEAVDVTVCVDHPLLRRTNNPAPLGHTPRGACRTLPDAGGLVYVVDAYPRLATLAKTILETAGFTTCAFDDRAMAWHAFAFANPKPALLITDNLDGDPAAKELILLCRSIAPRLKTLLVDHRLPSSRPTPDWTDGVIARPYCAPLLIQEVKRLCVSVRPGW
jgi:hypothetical protein